MVQSFLAEDGLFNLTNLCGLLPSLQAIEKLCILFLDGGKPWIYLIVGGCFGISAHRGHMPDSLQASPHHMSLARLPASPVSSHGGTKSPILHREPWVWIARNIDQISQRADLTMSWQNTAAVLDQHK